MFEAADGPLIIAVGNNNQFDKFCRQVIERPDIVEDPRYATNVERAKNRVTLTPLITGLIHEFPRDLLLERMTACGIPCGRVAGLHEALTSERTRRGGLMREMPHPVAGTTHVRRRTVWTESARRFAMHRRRLARARARYCRVFWI
jgi:crotonobetainyl-CoA:carnitine CoA-transferase CaiB-like acyl-CoA transferase